MFFAKYDHTPVSAIQISILITADAVMGISKLPVTSDSSGYEYDHPLLFFTSLCGSIHNAVNKKGVFVLFHQTLDYMLVYF